MALTEKARSRYASLNPQPFEPLGAPPNKSAFGEIVFRIHADQHTGNQVASGVAQPAKQEQKACEMEPTIAFTIDTELTEPVKCERIFWYAFGDKPSSYVLADGELVIDDWKTDSFPDGWELEFDSEGKLLKIRGTVNEVVEKPEIVCVIL
jgi:hypothetical protein